MSPRGKDIAVSANTVSADAATGRQDSRRWWALAAVSLAAFTPFRNSSIVVPSSAVTSRPFHKTAMPSSESLRAPFHDPLAEQAPGLGERRPGRHGRARLEAQARQAERRGQRHVIAGAGEHARDQHADHGHPRRQRPVIGVPVRRLL